jgi:cytochrome c oxidase subunit 2
MNTVGAPGRGLDCLTQFAGALQRESKGDVMKTGFMRWGLLAGIVVAAIFPACVAKAQAAPRRIEVTAKRFAFEPGEITLKRGQPVVLVLNSKDVAHGLRFRELNVDIKVSANGTKEVQFTPEKVGDFVGHCSVFCGSGHGGMALTLHVVN